MHLMLLCTLQLLHTLGKVHLNLLGMFIFFRYLIWAKQLSLIGFGSITAASDLLLHEMKFLKTVLLQYGIA